MVGSGRLQGVIAISPWSLVTSPFAHAIAVIVT